MDLKKKFLLLINILKEPGEQEQREPGWPWRAQYTKIKRTIKYDNPALMDLGAYIFATFHCKAQKLKKKLLLK